MHLIARIRARLAAQDGFTLVAVMGVMLAGMTLSVATFAASRGDVHLSRNDQDQKRAYAAAEAGVQDYFFHLTQDNAYWAKCASPSPSHPALNLAGASPLRTRRVPGSNAAYAIELLPANGRTACSTSDATGTMIQTGSGPMSGTFSLKATGYSNSVRRSVIATFRRRSFLDYLWFTDLETSDPAWYVLSTGGYATRAGTYSRSSGFRESTGSANPNLLAWAARSCPTYWRNGRGNLEWPVSPDNAWQRQNSDGTWGNTSTSEVGCMEIQFVSGDTMSGPMHTNDDLLVCGEPVFGRTTADSIEVSGSGWRSACSGSDPTVNGEWKTGSPVLTPPPSSTSLKQIASSSYLFRGRTTIVLSSGGISVTNDLLSPTTQTLGYPANGVIYVDHAATGCGVQAYQPLAPYNDPTGCANVYVRGTYGSDLTIASAKDIIVNGNVVRSGDRMLGLIADNFVRVYHPVVPDDDNPSDRTDCDNSASTPRDISISAAILALNHSFTVDSYFCGAPLGRLSVEGTIAQKHRGPVGRGSGYSVSNGYLKNYVYDDRLRLREPPHFIDPVQASWRIQRYAEQVG